MKASFIKSAFREGHYPPADRPEIAFAGKSNVGKSSLLNVLVNRKKMARTSSTPGRTQALNFFSINDRIYFVDLPGYGFAKVPISIKKKWNVMVENYFKSRRNLKAVVVILDVRRELSREDTDLLNWLNHYQIDPVVVITKIDKLSRNKCEGRLTSIGRELEGLYSGKVIPFSARTRQGRDMIWEIIEQQIRT